MFDTSHCGFIESEIEVVGRLSEEKLLQTQLGSRSGVDIEINGSKFARKLLDETLKEIKDKVSEYANKIVNGLNLSEEDIKNIIETNENPQNQTKNLKKQLKLTPTKHIQKMMLFLW